MKLGWFFKSIFLASFSPLLIGGCCLFFLDANDMPHPVHRVDNDQEEISCTKKHEKTSCALSVKLELFPGIPSNQEKPIELNHIPGFLFFRTSQIIALKKSSANLEQVEATPLFRKVTWFTQLPRAHLG